MEASPKYVFGLVLRRVRRERDLSQEALASSADLARNHVSELERARREPGLGTIVQLADALGMGAGELMRQFDQERARLQGREAAAARRLPGTVAASNPQEAPRSPAETPPLPGANAPIN